MIKARLERRLEWLGYKALKALYRGATNVKVGLISGKSDQDVINRGVWNEFGTKGGASGGGWGGPIPERPFMRNAMRANRAKYSAAMAKAAKDTIRAGANGSALRTGSPLRNVLDKLGLMAQGDVQREITTLSEPPNSPVTIKLKGSSNPLIDTGEMRQAVTFEVEE